jgi:hypothetical protein
MIRYSSYGSIHTPSERTYLEVLAAEHRELQELRERVKKAEAAQRKSRNDGKGDR